MGDDGTTLVEPTGELTIDPGQFGSARLEGERILRNEGTMEWREGDLFLSGSPTINNSGLLELNSQSGSVSRSSFGDAPLIHNTGTLAKTVGTGQSFVDVPVDNDGVLEIAAGRLSLAGGFSDRYAQSANGEHRVQLRGPAAATDFGVLEVDSEAKLNGELAIATASGVHAGRRPEGPHRHLRKQGWNLRDRDRSPDQSVPRVGRRLHVCRH